MHTAVGSRRLAVRMVAALLALVALSIAFAAGLWGVVWVVLIPLDIPVPWLWAAWITVAFLTTIGALEYWRRDRERHRGVTRVDPDDRVHRIATRAARQFDVPVPDFLVSDRSAPVAMAVGRRSGDSELVVSRGTLDALDDDELEAVIAHELAHLANHDAWVMTVASIPVVIADGITDLGIEDDETGLELVPKSFAMVTEFVGRILVAIFGRERERAADRAAARVTGSPANLASALATLDASVAATPDRDLRSVAGESTMSIVALEDPTEPLMLGPDGERRPTLWPVRKRFRVWTRSHPPTEERIERLQAMAAAQS